MVLKKAMNKCDVLKFWPYRKISSLFDKLIYMISEFKAGKDEQR